MPRGPCQHRPVTTFFTIIKGAYGASRGQPRSAAGSAGGEQPALQISAASAVAGWGSLALCGHWATALARPFGREPCGRGGSAGRWPAIPPRPVPRRHAGNRLQERTAVPLAPHLVTVQGSHARAGLRPVADAMAQAPPLRLIFHGNPRQLSRGMGKESRHPLRWYALASARNYISVVNTPVLTFCVQVSPSGSRGALRQRSP